jgi:hypothetical protein
VDETQAETALEQQVQCVLSFRRHIFLLHWTGCLAYPPQHLAALEELRQAQLLRKEQAREQAYLARMKQLADAEAEAEAAEAAGQVQEQTEQHAAEEARSPGGAEASEDAGTGRKRRRQVRASNILQAHPQCAVRHGW